MIKVRCHRSHRSRQGAEETRKGGAGIAESGWSVAWARP